MEAKNLGKEKLLVIGKAEEST